VALGLLALAAVTVPLQAQTAPAKPTTLKYDSVNTVIAALMPAAQKENVKNVAFSAQGTELRMDADVRLSAVPGMEMMAALGFARMTGLGPVSIVSPVSWAGVSDPSRSRACRWPNRSGVRRCGRPPSETTMWCRFPWDPG
jgi:hypothetical protein